ncbi:DNA replication licensing factor MCM3, putative [Plasmodium vinckei vinckei]|uniref:DNA replication licensing factor MCM3 n=1 Tax=Plasmodium vinckei vinckei TaxID=54757 RepID=A0A449BX29_PLAVN|nr:DNA replication licensing factor MCM3, putative [Plasmodium vinckei vinckei]KEG03732.1 minichromosome maintenance protein 3 [Plasmodium vinckei vinckei]VEV58026.1 DNA replication licensing factor MCM3, putative [Plasmodium vinckei vinckei]
MENLSIQKSVTPSRRSDFRAYNNSLINYTLMDSSINNSSILDNSMRLDKESKERKLQKINDNIISEYESGRQSVVFTQQKYKQLLEGFLLFVQTNKYIHQKITELRADATEEYNKMVDKNIPNIIIHQRLICNINNFQTGNEQFELLAKCLIKEPYLALPAYQAAIKELWKSQDSKIDIECPKIGISGWLGRHHVTPRGLQSSMINKLVAVEGVVNKCSTVQPKLVQSVYIGEAVHDINADVRSEEKTVHLRPHYDITDFDKTAKDSGRPPASDPEGKIMHRHEIGLCKYKNHQKFVIQETPEDAPTGQMPRWVEVIVEDDLCDIVKCGDRVRVWGVYRASCGQANSTNSGLGRSFLIANNVLVKNKETYDTNLFISEADKKNFHAFAKKQNTIDILGYSFAPSICGQDIVKKGIVLMLAGGTERALPSHHIRGDIHIMLVGDPSCGKSQLLRYVMSIMPGTVSATGRGSSGVGLTAAIVTDQDTGERVVEGGAMVMGDRRVVCIDEFDKMQQTDRVAIHEVMEQQTVTVAKAGIHTTLNARCTVLAAANPLYGCWNDSLDMGQQLQFEPSLLSRFDLIFLVRDSTTEKDDERIAESVLRNVTEKAKPILNENRNSQKNFVIQADSYDINQKAQHISIYNEREVNNNNNNDPNNAQDNEEFETPIFANRDEMIYYDKDGVEHEILTVPFFKKYLHYVKNVFYNEKQRTDGWKPYPEVSDEACEVITELYADLREKAAKYSHNKIIQGVTPRTLEAIIRIASSHAKLKLNRYVTSVDVNYAKKLLMYTLFGEEIVESEDEYEEDDEEEEDYEDDDDEEYIHKSINRKTKTKTKKRTAEKQTTSRKKNKTNKSKDNQDDNLMIDNNKSASAKATPLDVKEIERLIVENVTLNDPGDGLRDEALLDLIILGNKEKMPHLAKLDIATLRKIINSLNEMDGAPIYYVKKDKVVYKC